MSSTTSLTVLPIFSEPRDDSSRPFLVGTLLTLDATRILLDVAWSEAFDAEAVLAPLRRLAPTLDAVLISFGDLSHAGALPLLYRPTASGGAGCTASVYLTPPAFHLGRFALLDAHDARVRGDSEWEAAAFTHADVSMAFAMREFGGPAVHVRYGEECGVGSGGVVATAYAAGHKLGGAMWRVVKGAESVVYAPRFHHRGESHLPRANLSNTFLQSPSALLLDGAFAGMALGIKPPSTAAGVNAAAVTASWTLPLPPTEGPGGVKPKDVWQVALTRACVAVMQKGGCVLLPCDSSGRCLEVLLRLDAEYGVKYPWPIFFLSSVANSVLEHSRTMLEFMGDTVVKNLEFSNRSGGSSSSSSSSSGSGSVVGTSSPFVFPPNRSRVNPTTSLEQVQEYVASGRPCCILATASSSSCGYSRALLQQMAGSQRNAVIFTSRSDVAPGSFGAQLLPPLAPLAGAATGGGGSGAAGGTQRPLHPPSVVTMPTSTITPLSGVELQAWREGKEEERKRVARAAAAARARASEDAELAEAASATAAAMATAAAAAAAAATAAAAVVVVESVGGSSSSGGGGINNPSLAPSGSSSASSSSSSSSSSTMVQEAPAVVASSGAIQPPGASDAMSDGEAAASGGGGGDGGGSSTAAAVSLYAPDDRALLYCSGLPADHLDETVLLRPPLSLQPGNWSRGNELRARFPLFGRDTERDAHFTPSEYGMVVGPGEWGGGGGSAALASLLSTPVTTPAAAAAASMLAAATSASSAAATAAAAVAAAGEAPPTRRTKGTLTVHVSCRIALHPLEGAALGMEMLECVEVLRPAKLVLLPCGDAGSKTTTTTTTTVAASGGSGSTSAPGVTPPPLLFARAFAAAANAAKVTSGPVDVLGEAFLLPPPTSSSTTSSSSSSFSPTKVPSTPTPLDISSGIAEVFLRIVDSSAAVASLGPGAPQMTPLVPTMVSLGTQHTVAFITAQLTSTTTATTTAAAGGNGGEEGQSGGVGLGAMVLSAPPPPSLLLLNNSSSSSSSPQPSKMTEEEEGGPAMDGHWPFLVRLGGPLRLLEVRGLLAAQGVSSEIYEGTLVTGGGVLVRPTRVVVSGGAAMSAAATAAPSSRSGKVLEAMDEDGEEEDEEDVEERVGKGGGGGKGGKLGSSSSSSGSSNGGGRGGNGGGGKGGKSEVRVGLEVEGPLTKEYFKVREVLEQQYLML